MKLLPPCMFLLVFILVFHATQAFAGPVDRIVVEKAKRIMTLYSGKKPFKSYRIALGGEPRGPKERQGDHKTPEGVYKVDRRNAKSSYHRALHVSYPNEQDRKRARTQGVSPGGDIMIHGLPNGQGWLGASHVLYDWTDGCIAVTNAEIEEIWKLIPDGTVVEILP